MRRYLLRMLFSLSMLFLISAKFVDLTVGSGFGRHPLEVAWSATGLAADRFTLDYWATCNEWEASTDPGRAARRIASRLGVKRPRVFSGSKGGVAFANLDGTLTDGGEVFLTVQAEGSVTNIGLSCYYRGLPGDLLSLIGRIRLAAPRGAARGSFCWTVEGSPEGPLDATDWRGMWVRVLDSVGAARRGDRPGDEVVEAYTPLLPPMPATDSGRANLVLTLRQRGKVSLIRLSSPDASLES